MSTGRFKAELDVDSTQVDQIKVGDTVTVTVSSGSSSNGFPGLGNFPGATDGNGNGGANGNTNGGGNAGSAGNTGGTSNASATGTVTEVGRVASASSGVAQYPITIEFATDSSSFVDGTSITGSIATKVSATDVLQVPVRAVTTSDGVSTVTVALDGDADGRDGEAHRHDWRDGRRAGRDHRRSAGGRSARGREPGGHRRDERRERWER